MSDQLNDQQISEYRELFALIDKNGDGAIDAEELGQAMRSLGQNHTNEELKNLINDVDSDNNGRIDFNEFLIIVSRMKGNDETENDLLEAFKIFDEDQDGNITQDEIRSVMSSLGRRWTSQELDVLIGKADTDGDGKINYKEFVKMMSAN
ncbi:calmodulin [Mucor ambiguus]|uniref:Calmodulin n=1 Tax=Mucor ambiguus TaxID=91626 RepID=A0A0C9LVI0_9FUNG|nr:calmodulin [Mucor ambiguus]